MVKCRIYSVAVNTCLYIKASEGFSTIEDETNNSIYLW